MRRLLEGFQSLHLVQVEVLVDLLDKLQNDRLVRLEVDAEDNARVVPELRLLLQDGTIRASMEAVLFLKLRRLRVSVLIIWKHLYASN